MCRARRARGWSGCLSSAPAPRTQEHHSYNVHARRLRLHHFRSGQASTANACRRTSFMKSLYAFALAVAEWNSTRNRPSDIARVRFEIASLCCGHESPRMHEWSPACTVKPTASAASWWRIPR
jgi:hypothetical protein